MKKLILLTSLLVFSLASAVWAISGISFSTDQQSVAVGAISAVITVTSGEAPGETSDLFISSSSGAGEFSSNATNWTPVTQLTWNSNYKSRSFYYRDSAEGAPTITARLVGRISGQAWTATQVITIGSGGGAAPASAGGTNSTDSGDDNDGGDGGAVATQTLVNKPKSSTGSSVFRVKAEIPSVGALQTPIQFRISGDGLSNPNHYSWSFGDGAVARGAIVEHGYDYPGVYTVVLTARKGKEVALIRANIEIVEPKVVVREIAPGARGYVELENQSSRELNLEHWQMVDGDQKFAILGPTYIPARGRLKLAASVTGLRVDPQDQVALYYPSRELAYLYRRNQDGTEEVLQRVAIAMPRTLALKPALPVPSRVLAPQPSAPTTTVIIGSRVNEKSWWQKIFSP